MHRYTLRSSGQFDVPAASEKARELRRLDDGLHPPDISGLDLYGARDALTKHQAAVDAVKADRARAANAAVSPWWRTRPAKLPDGSPNDWPPWCDIDAWRGLGASHALLCTPSRLETTHRPHEQAYNSAYRAVFGAYMDTPETTKIDEAIASHAEPGPRDTSEHGDPHSLAWSAEIGKIAGAYARAQASMGELVASHKAKIKTNKGADFEYSFANIADALKACLGAFNAEGCAVLQPVTTFKGGVEVRTVVIHESGQWLRSGILVLPAHGDAQAIGSAITYARRYQILGMVGLAPSDDDGASATASARSGSGHDYEPRASSGSSPSSKKADAIGARCSGAKWPGDLGREVHQLAQDLATLGGADPMDVWWALLPDAGVDQQPYMDTDGEWPSQARVLSTSDGKLVKEEALKKIADARQT